MARKFVEHPGDERWEVGQEGKVEITYLKRELSLWVRREQFEWFVWFLGSGGARLAPVSTGDYKGDNLEKVIYLTKKSLLRTRRMMRGRR